MRDQLTELVRKFEDVVAPLSLRYNALSMVERLVLMGLAALIIIVLMIVLVWAPLYEWKETQWREAQRYEALIDWVQAEAPKVSQQSRSASLPAGQSLQAVLVRDAQRAKVTLQRYEPKGDNELRVWINEVDFERLVGWLVILEQRYGVSVTDISVEYKPSAPGMVKATIVFVA